MELDCIDLSQRQNILKFTVAILLFSGMQSILRQISRYIIRYKQGKFGTVQSNLSNLLLLILAGIGFSEWMRCCSTDFKGCDIRYYNHIHMTLSIHLSMYPSIHHPSIHVSNGQLLCRILLCSYIAIFITIQNYVYIYIQNYILLPFILIYQCIFTQLYKTIYYCYMQLPSPVDLPPAFVSPGGSWSLAGALGGTEAAQQ